ncbi:MAG TPA: protein kinase [Urbifossiella sp.]|nr:protein kinase [Urbifossiella sp.]
MRGQESNSVLPVPIAWFRSSVPGPVYKGCPVANSEYPGTDEKTVASPPRSTPSPSGETTGDYPASDTDPETTADSAPPAGFPPHAGQCRLVGEIGRGGMGVVLRGRDPFFDRALAVKVLLARPADHPDLARRFLAEARLTGRLQHPGVPPVHEQGALDDGRPYFTMKLIEGRTLDAILKDRADSLHDLPRFVTVFGQVCQTVGYAHSLRIVHRDLKPANIMVGAFGEVQVMDWGLAKEVGAGGEDAVADGAPESGDTFVTVAGQAVGTPAYMPPEQARGAHDELDERADVFGLGAILCKVLTGHAPYRGPSGAAVLEMARRADLAEARERLGACGADPELIRIALECLAPEPAARPRDAAAVAAAVTAYQAGVADRLKAAEIDRAAAQARARAERARRRLTVALAVTVLAAGATAGAVWARLQQQRLARQTQTVQQASEALGKARLLAEQAAAVPLTDLARWREAEALCRAALAAAEQADQAATAGEPDARTRQEVDDLLPRLRAEADDTSRDRAMIETLHAVRYVANDAFGDDDMDRYLAAHGNEERFVYSRVSGSEQYAQVFREYGIDAGTLSAEAVVAAVGSRRIRAHLVAALIDWLRLTDAGPMRDKLLLIARSAAAAAPADRLWDALARNDGAALEALAATPAAARLPLPAVLMLADALFYDDRVRPAVALLRRVQRAEYPDDYWVNTKLGEYLMFVGGSEAPQVAEATRFFNAAVVGQPRSNTARVNLADALTFAGELDGAEAAYRQVLSDQPGLVYVRVKLATFLVVAGRHAEGLEESRRAVAQRPQSAFVHEGHGGVCLMVGRHDDAAAAFRAAIRIRPDIATYHVSLGNALAQKGDLAGAEAAHREAVRLKPAAQSYANLANALLARGRTSDAIDAARTAVRLQPGSTLGRAALAAATAADGRKAEAVEMYRATVALVPHDAALWWQLASLLRSEKRYDEALVAVREAIRVGPKHGPRAAVLQNQQGLIHDHLGQHAAAAAAFRRAAVMNPSDATVRENLGDSLLDAGDATAGDAFREAIKIDPDRFDPRDKLAVLLARQGKLDEALALLAEAGPDHAAAFHRRVRLYQERGRHRDALDLIEPWLDAKPKDAVARHLLGVSLVQTGRLPEAVGAFERVLTTLPAAGLDYRQVSLDLGTALITDARRLENEGSVEAAEAAAARGHSYRAWAWNKAGRKRAAADEARRAIALQPQAASYHRLLGDCLREVDPEQALAAYRAAAEDFSDRFQAETLPRLADVLTDLDRPAEALAALAPLVGRGRANPAAHRSAGRALMESGQLAEAADHFKTAGDVAAERRCRRLLSLEPVLADYRAGAGTPAADDLLDLAELCRLKGLPHAASRLFAGAAAADPLRPERPEFHQSARASAQAGAGRGDAAGLGEADLRRHRDAALARLRVELAATAKSLPTAEPADAAIADGVLARWRRDPALHDLRDPGGLILYLDAAEREAWEGFWSDVAAVQQVARSRTR